MSMVAASLVACGGGGGSEPPPPGSGNPPPSNPPPSNPPPSNPPPSTPPPSNPPATPEVALVVPFTTVSFQGESISPVGATHSVQLLIENHTGPDPIVLSGSYSTNAIQTASLSVLPSGISLVLGFRAPQQLPVGTYTDTVTIRACRESPCVNHIAGSPKQITVNYTVVAPAVTPTMTLQTGSVSIDGFVLDSTPPPWQNVDVTITRLANSNPPFVRVTSATNLADVRGNTLMEAVPNYVQRLTFMLPPASTLGVGTHTDVLTVRGCLDSNCVHEVSGSPATIQVTFTVSGSSSGPNGYSARPVAAEANELVWDAARQVIYLSIPATAAANANSIGVLDPQTGVISGHVPAGSNPGDMEISPDGQYLYVALRGAGVIERRLLPSLALDLTIPLGTRPANGATLYAKEFHVSPTASGTIAVVRSGSPTASGSEHDLAIFDGAAMRAQTVPAGVSGAVTTFQWDSGTRIFGVDSSSSTGRAFHVAVDAGGATVAASQENVTAFDRDAMLVEGRMIMQSGRVFDPLTFAQIGSFAHGSPFTVAATPDTTTRKAFFLVHGAVRAFDLDTFTAIASITLPDAAPTLNARQIRWGRDGLALLNYQHSLSGILLINGPFVQP